MADRREGTQKRSFWAVPLTEVSGLTRDEQTSARLLPPGTKCGAPRLEIVALSVVLDDGADALLVVASYGGESQIGEAIGYGWLHGNQSIRVSARNLFFTTAIATTVSPVRHGFRKNRTDRLSVDDKKRQFIVEASLIGTSVPKGIQAKPESAGALR